MTHQEVKQEAASLLIKTLKADLETIKGQTGYWSEDFIEGYEAAIHDLELTSYAL